METGPGVLVGRGLKKWESISWRSSVATCTLEEAGARGKLQTAMALGVILMAKAPGLIFLIDGLDVSAYASLEDVVFDAEPVDAKDHDFLICDADGRLVQLSTDRGYVTASLAEAEPTHAAELETALRKFLGAMNEPLAADATCDLVCLVLTCHKFVKVTRRPKNTFSEVWHKLFPSART